jgi:LacI family transcriptional regulator
MTSTPKVVLLMSPFAGYERGLLRGIARYARLHGPWVFYLSGEPGLPMPQLESFDGGLLPLRRISGGTREWEFPDLRAMGATGFIGRIQTPAVAKAVLKAGLPAIAMDLSEEQLAAGNPLAQLSEIMPDSPKTGRLAAEHFLDRGFRQFAFCGYRGRIWSQRREEGFARRLKEAGFTYRAYKSLKRRSVTTSSRELPRLLAWLQSLPKPVGILACNDIRGRAIINACAIGDILVPDDVAVVGVDEDRLLCELSNPSLSSVALNSEQGGYQAAELLNRMMSGRACRRQLIRVDPLWVVSRRSTEVIAVADREVANGMRFIRDNAKRPIRVADVVEKSSVSRRALEMRFQRTLGRSIREEIERTRLAWTKQLLLETDLPISEIVETTGFNTLSYASKVFHRATGATLARYRREHRAP